MDFVHECFAHSPKAPINVEYWLYVPGWGFFVVLLGVLSNTLALASGQQSPGLAVQSLQVATASSTSGTTTARPLPVHFQADHRALPHPAVALALIPLLLLLLMALRPGSRVRSWCQISFKDVLGMFSPIGRRRHVIHDQSYLDRVLEVEFGDRGRPSCSPTPSVSPSSSGFTEASPSPEELLGPTANEAKDLPS